MPDLVERVARAVATEDWRSKINETAEPSRWLEAKDAYDLTNNNGRFRYDEMARAAIDATGYATLETALRTIQSAVPKYLKKEMTAEEFALAVIGEVDNKAVFRALEGKAETGRA